MTTGNINLLQAITSKMQYLDQRHSVLAENIANSDTPGYRSRDLEPVDFGRMLQKSMRTNSIRAERTHSAHQVHSGEAIDGKSARKIKDRTPYEVEPSGNTVVLEEQLMKSSQNTMDYSLMTALYDKSVNLMRIAINSGR